MSAVPPAGRNTALDALLRFASRLKYPQVFLLLLAVFALDLLIPDLIPFVDEILLGLLTALFGTWRERRRAPYDQEEPREKNITPPRK